MGLCSSCPFAHLERMRETLTPRYLISFLLPAIAVQPGTAPAAPATPAAPALPDLDVGLHQIRGMEIDISVPAFDAAKHAAPLVAVHAVLLPSGHGQPSTADDWMSSSYDKFSAPSPGKAGGIATIDASALAAKVTAPTDYVGAVIREFAA